MGASKVKRDRLWFGIMAGILLLAILVRAWASLRLSVDFDEPTYLEAAYDYARLLEDGDLTGVIDYPEIREHPALVKLVYGLMVLGLGLDTDWQVALYVGRLVSALFGVLAVLVMARRSAPPCISESQGSERGAAWPSPRRPARDVRAVLPLNLDRPCGLPVRPWHGIMPR